jgi:hypothetical protein
LRDTSLTGRVSLMGFVPILGANICSPFFSKACGLKNNSKVDLTLHRPFSGLMAIFAINQPYPIKRLAKYLDEISSCIYH